MPDATFSSEIDFSPHNSVTTLATLAHLQCHEVVTIAENKKNGETSTKRMRLPVNLSSPKRYRSICESRTHGVAPPFVESVRTLQCIGYPRLLVSGTRAARLGQGQRSGISRHGSSSSRQPFTDHDLHWQGGPQICGLRHGPAANSAISSRLTVLTNLLDLC